MRVEIMRTGRKRGLIKKGNERIANDVAMEYGYRKVNVLDIENYENIQWEGIEFNRLFAKDGILYVFKHWLGKFPFEGIVLEEIGKYGE